MSILNKTEINRKSIKEDKKGKKEETVDNL